MNELRYDRQILAFGKEGHSKIEATLIGIVGLGGIGSHVAQGLAYLGAQNFLLVDDDHVEETNLNRLIGGLPGDAERNEAKVQVAARTIRSIQPGANVHAVEKNVRSQEAIDALIRCTVIFGCVDNEGSRLVLMELAAAFEATLIDSATEILSEEGTVTEFGGRVVIGRPGDFCLRCANEIDMDVAKQELETPRVRELRKQHGYGLGERGTAPAVVSLNGIIANLAVTEFLVMTTGIRDPKRYLVYYGLRGKVNAREDLRRPDCYVCGYLVGSREKANLHRYALLLSK